MTKQMQIIEKFLNDFIAVQGIDETALKDFLTVVSVPADFLIRVKGEGVDFGVRLRPSIQDGKFIETNEVFGTPLQYAGAYANTYKAIRDYGCKQIRAV